MKRAAITLALTLAGCTDIFQLTAAPNDMNVFGAADFRVLDAGPLGDGGLVIASCALLPCSPATNEGTVTVSGGTLTGCHAYDTLIVNGTARFDTFTACARSIVVSGILDGNGSGFPVGKGPGAGSICGSGAGHGGAGADPDDCGGGMVYGDVTHPRETGSGGGAFVGGNGGGQLELAAGSIDLTGLIRANGTDGAGAVAGGGSGGSVLLEADLVSGGGSIEAKGGAGAGFRGGGGGGGRVVVVKTNSGRTFDVDVSGGASTAGDPGGGGVVQQ